MQSDRVVPGKTGRVSCGVPATLRLPVVARRWKSSSNMSSSKIDRFNSGRALYPRAIAAPLALGATHLRNWTGFYGDLDKAAPITLAIPDAGPLISLAQIDALDVLMALGERVKIVVTDIVVYEVTHNIAGHDDAKKIRSFLSANSSRVLVESTSYGALVLKSAKMDPEFLLPDDAGEMAIVSYMTRVDASTPTLVLVEDYWFESHRPALRSNVHLITTRSFLAGLQAIDPSFPLDELTRRLDEAARTTYLLDCAGLVENSPTEWRSAVSPDDLSVRPRDIPRG